MKQYALFLLVFAGLFCGKTSYCQNTMMTGRIVDEDGAPVKGALVQLRRGGEIIETKSGDDGLFYTGLLQTGRYRMGVEADGVYYKMKKILLYPPDEKQYYYLKIIGGRVFVTVNGKDPFLKSRLTKIANEAPEIDMGGPGTFYVKYDSVSGKAKPLYGGTGAPPRMK